MEGIGGGVDGAGLDARVETSTGEGMVGASESLGGIEVVGELIQSNRGGISVGGAIIEALKLRVGGSKTSSECSNESRGEHGLEQTNECVLAGLGGEGVLKKLGKRILGMGELRVVNKRMGRGMRRK